MPLLFATALFVSATLLFVMQPLFARMVLPSLGGTPAVWNTCMVFYQAVLLAGYVYAHLSIKWLGPRRQAVMHLVLLGLPWLVLPVALPSGWQPPAEANPIPWLLLLLTASVGLPLLILSTTAPLVQAWFADTGHPAARDPYFLYAASNLGSMLALLGYPLVIEPLLSLRTQSWCWAAGYGLLMVLLAGCAVRLWRSPAAIVAKTGKKSTLTAAAPPTWPQRLRWLLLALVPSSLLLGVTTFLSTDIAAVPLLWVIPLALYLLTFVLVFARRAMAPPRVLLALQTVAIVSMGAAFFVVRWNTVPFLVAFLCHLSLFFLTAMVLHGELAASRPAPAYLTEFYLWMSLGGVLGGLVNALVAPSVFNGVFEYPLAIAAACLLRPRAAAVIGNWHGTRYPAAVVARLLDLLLPLAVLAVFGWVTMNFPPWEWASCSETAAQGILVGATGLAVLRFQRRPLRLGLGMFALMAVSLLASGEGTDILYRHRSFYGVLRVKYRAAHDSHLLAHGSTNHGLQCLEPARRREPMAYYHRLGPVGDLFTAARTAPLHRVGVVGLGAGAIAAYGERGQRFTFYEIDPAVVAVARDPQFFTYLSDSPAEVEIVLGDARLSLARRPRQAFDVLLLDAFSSDAIPVHLLTREAVGLYFENLAPHGILAVHISNRSLDLAPVVARLAADCGYTAMIRDDNEDAEGKYASTWVAIARTPADLKTLPDLPGWRPLVARPGSRVWTDDYSNLVGALKW